MQFVRESHPNWEELDYFSFRFTDDYLELELKKEQCHKGWLICPGVYPCKVSDVPTNHAVHVLHILVMLTPQIYQKDVDVLCKKPSCCQVRVIAQKTSETAQYLNYEVPIKNIDPEYTVFIQCSRPETEQTSELWETHLHSNHNRYYC